MEIKINETKCGEITDLERNLVNPIIFKEFCIGTDGCEISDTIIHEQERVYTGCLNFSFHNDTEGDFFRVWFPKQDIAQQFTMKRRQGDLYFMVSFDADYEGKIALLDWWESEGCKNFYSEYYGKI